MLVGAGIGVARAGVSCHLGGAHESRISAEGRWAAAGAGGIRGGRQVGWSYREALGKRRIVSMGCRAEVGGIGVGVRGRRERCR